MTLPNFDPVQALEVLTRHGVRFIVIGAFSGVVQGYPLTTADLDVTPAKDAENLERLSRAMDELDAHLRVPGEERVAFPIDVRMLEQADVWPLSTNAGPLDLVFQPAGTQGYGDLRRDAVEQDVRGITVSLASLRDVIRMKEASNRPKDIAQLPALRQTLEVIREREESA